MALPNILSTFFLAVIYFALRWVLSHIGEFSIPPIYLDVVTGLLDVSIAAIAKLVAERNRPASEAAIRGMGEPENSYWKRVIYK